MEKLDTCTLFQVEAKTLDITTITLIGLHLMKLNLMVGRKEKLE